MNKEVALNGIQNAINNITLLRNVSPFSAEHTRWIIDTRILLGDIFGQGSLIYRTFVGLTWRPRGSVVAYESMIDMVLQSETSKAYLADLEMAKGLLQAGIDQIMSAGIEKVFHGRDTSEESSEIIKILSLVETKLRKIIRNPPLKESEVTDALENLFVGAGLDPEFNRETETVAYSTKGYKPDFTFKRLGLAVEAKLCDSVDKEKALISEINDDILAYKSSYPNVIFVVYDKGFIRDQDKFRGSIEKAKEDVLVRVVKH